MINQLKRNSLVLIWLIVSLTSFAYDFEVDGFYYNHISGSSNKVEITYKTERYGSYSGSIFIPETFEYQGKMYYVTTIGDRAFYESPIDFVYIPSTITAIGKESFAYCSLKSVTLPSSIENIGDGAFYREGYDFTMVKSKIKNPMIIESRTFSRVNQLVNTLYVPNGTKTLYNKWAYQFNTIIESSEEVDIKITSRGNGYTYYNSMNLRNHIHTTECVLGNSFTMEFEPDNGYRIKSVKVNNSDVTSSVSNNSYTISSISANTTVEVEFEAIPITTYTLSVKATGNGSATYDGTTAQNGTKSFTLNEGANATIMITPENGYRIKSVKMNSTDVTSQVLNNQYTISNIKSNITVEVEFETIPSIGSTFEVNGLFYTIISRNEVEITYKRGGGSYSGNVNIPETITYNGVDYIVASIGYRAFYNCTECIGSLIIPNTITSIGDGAFSGCSGFTGSLVIPNSVKTIKEYAFRSCSGFTSLTLSNSLTTIGSMAFAESYGYSGILTLPKTLSFIGEMAFRYCTNITMINSEIEKPFEISDDVFQYISSNAVLQVPQGTKSNYQSISGWTKNFKSIIEQGGIITYSLSIQAIGNGQVTYDGTTVENKTKSFTLNEGISATLMFSLDNGYRIKSVKVNSTDVTSSISNNSYTISNISDNTTVEVEFEAIPVVVTTYTLTIKATGNGSATYDGTTAKNNTKTFTLDEGTSATITITPDNGYRIKSVKVNSKDVTSSVSNNQYTVSNIKANTTVEVEFKAIPITTYTLSISATGNGSVSYNGTAAKNNTKSFTLNEGTAATITITPDNGYRIKSVKVNSSDVISSVSNNQYTVSNINANTTVEVEFEAIPEPEPTPVDNFNVDGINYHVSAAGIIQVTSADQGVKNIVIPLKVTYEGISYTVTSIADKAFERNTAITSVQIPNSVTEIGKNAFGACSNLSSITLPNSVSEIGDAAFYGCSSLFSVSLPNGLKQIGESLFWGCTGLNSVTIPGSVTNISEEAFLECQNLESVFSEIEKPFDIPNNVFEGISSTAILIVPTGTKYTYEQSSGWTMHFAKVKEMGVPDSYRLTISALGSGVITYDDVSIRNSSRSFDVETGTSATITYKADEGYQIKSITVNDRVIQTDKSQYVIDVMDEDLTIAVEFEAIPIKTYTLKYVVDGETYMSYQIEEGVAVTHEAEPTKEGYTFSGWSEIPATMPANDVTIIGLFIVNLYKLIYQVDGDEYKTYSIEYGAVITPEAEPIKEGYTFSGWSEIPTTMPANDLTITGIFTKEGPDISELGKIYTIAGVNYEVVSTDNQMVVVAAGDYGQILEVPASIEYGEYSWDVIGLKDGALDNCEELAAVIWNPTIAFNARVSNPNLLLYVKDEAYKSLGVKNVIINGIAGSIELADAANGNDFYCPRAFTAKKISYSHYYNMETGLGDSKGWETIVLPFDVQKYTGRKGEIVPFTKWTESSSTKPFWLFELTASGYKDAEGIKANIPYIISMPNNPQYLADYVITGIVTFSAENVEVKASDDMKSAHYQNRTFIPNYINLNDDNCFALNVNNYYVTNSSTDKNGSKFIKGLRSIHPFEAYMTTTSNTRSIDVLDGMTTAVKDIMIATESTDIIKVYDTKGVLVKTTNVNDDLRKGLKAGVYIVNGKKMIIK